MRAAECGNDSRFRQQQELFQQDLFASVTVSDYLFAKDRIFAALTLDENELSLYERVFDALGPRVTKPDLVIYLQAPTEVLIERLRRRAADAEGDDVLDPGDDYLRELNEAYQHFFFHYTATPLLVVETSQIDLATSDQALDDLLRQIKTMNRGTRYYVPRK